MSSVRILVVDDFAPWRRFVVTKLQEQCSLQVIAVVADGLEAVQKAAELQPDLILMDVGLPRLNGIEAARQIGNLAPKSKILFVSQNLDPDVVRITLSAGGKGFVIKSDAESELLPAVDAVMLGKQYLSRSVALHVLTDIRRAPVLDRLRCQKVREPLLPQEKESRRCHEAQFYADEVSLLDSFTRFIGAALDANNAVIVVATESHRKSLFQRLQELGVDPWGATECGRYISLDAADMLSTFMVDDMPDSARFLRVVGDLVMAAAKRAKGDDPRVAACGECAPLLWAEGRADAVIWLEELWNEIAKTYDIDILCGYPLSGFHREENNVMFQRICAAHSATRSW